MRDRILVVDDSPTIRAFTSRILEDEGYEVRSAEDVWIAGILSEFHPDLVLMDVELGVTTNGAKTVEILKKASRTVRPILVLYSSLDVDRLRDLCDQSGADGYFHKDGDPDVLKEKVRGYLSARRAARS